MRAPITTTSSRPLPTLEDLLAQHKVSLVQGPACMAYPHHWQLPAATEKAAWDAIHASRVPLDFEYWGFPWATVIDGLRGDTATVAVILMALGEAIERSPMTRKGKPRVTVAQHIHALKFVDLFKASGITDLFWSHATHHQPEIEGIRLHPFPLFPAQAAAESTPVDLAKPRRYLANFIGAYSPGLYLSNVRDVIFRDMHVEEDLLIVKRASWHFDRAVYEEQIQGIAPNEARLRAEVQHADEYRDAIRNSWFTFCPSGSGPNSIRITESLCLGSIPIVLTRDLRLAGPASLWERAALIEDDSAEGYARAKHAARALPEEHRLKMIDAGRELLAWVAPTSWGRLISSAFDASSDKPLVC